MGANPWGGGLTTLTFCIPGTSSKRTNGKTCAVWIDFSAASIASARDYRNG
jgi:hypothetical protein